MNGIVGYGAYLPHWRLRGSAIAAALGSGGGRGRAPSPATTTDASTARRKRKALTHNLGGAPGACVSFVSVVGDEPDA